MQTVSYAFLTVVLLAASSPTEPDDQSLPAAGAKEQAPVAIHPDNSHYFLFRGRPLVLIAATEHYGSVVNRRFDFERYLRDAAGRQQTVTRLFLLFRELQSARNPSSPVKPESPDFVAPWVRSGPGKAMDGEPTYDLDHWNPEYFARLRRFLTLASELGIVVEVTLLSNTYGESIWALNPLRAANNVQGVGKIDWPEYTTLKDRSLVSRQLAYVRKVIQETCGFDNLYYEICNEPGGNVRGHATREEVDAWQTEIAHAVREELARRGRKHLIFGAQAFVYAPKFTQELDASFQDPKLDAVNVHPLPDTVLGGRRFMLGNFMSKELTLAELRDFCLQAYRQNDRPKPFVLDEDNAASLYRDDEGWTIHRKRAWVGVMSGAHYDFIDFSITVGNESGTPESRRKIRSWMGNLSGFIHGFDFLHASPVPDWIEKQPSPLVVAALAVPGKDYAAYLADGRERTDPTAGATIRATVSFKLPSGTYALSLYSPTSGAWSPALQLEGNTQHSVDLPSFRHDTVLRVTRLP